MFDLCSWQRPWTLEWRALVYLLERPMGIPYWDCFEASMDGAADSWWNWTRLGFVTHTYIYTYYLYHYNCTRQMKSQCILEMILVLPYPAPIKHGRLGNDQSLSMTTKKGNSMKQYGNNMTPTSPYILVNGHELRILFTSIYIFIYRTYGFSMLFLYENIHLNTYVATAPARQGGDPVAASEFGGLFHCWRRAALRQGFKKTQSPFEGI